jgi:hypothetical protein
VGGGPAEIQPARSWGSHASKLVQALRKGHYDVKLGREDFDRIATWVDLNAPYYPTYASAYPNNFTGRCPLDDRSLARLAALTGVAFTQLNSFSSNRGPQVSFDRPTLSPCLAKLRDADEAKYREALAIIQSGREQLARVPREDMDGARPSQADRQRDEKYLARRAAELRSREAIRDAAKVYDAPPASRGRPAGAGIGPG